MPHDPGTGSLRIRSFGNTSLACALSCIIERSDSSSVVSPRGECNSLC